MRSCIGRALGLGTFTLIANIFQYFNENVYHGEQWTFFTSFRKMNRHSWVQKIFYALMLEKSGKLLARLMVDNPERKI